METLEILIYIVIATIAGTLLLGFITDWQYSKTYDALKGGLSKRPGPELQEITKDEFVSSLFTIFSQCRETENKLTANYYVQGTGSFGKAELFGIVKQLNWCNSIQSLEFGCGAREDVVFSGQIMLPGVVKVECSQQVLYIQS